MINKSKIAKHKKLMTDLKTHMNDKLKEDIAAWQDKTDKRMIEGKGFIFQVDKELVNEARTLLLRASQSL